MDKITHEKAIKEIKDIDLFIGHNGDGYTTTLKEYITQQEKKDDLLNLYVNYSRTYETLFIKLKEDQNFKCSEYYSGLLKEIQRLSNKITKAWSDLYE